MHYYNKILLSATVLAIAVGGWWISRGFTTNLVTTIVDASVPRVQVEQLLGLNATDSLKLLDWRGEQGRGYVLAAIVHSETGAVSLFMSFWPEAKSVACDQNFFVQSLDSSLGKNWPAWNPLDGSLPASSQCFHARGQVRKGSSSVDTAIWFSPQTKLIYVREVGI